MNTFLSLIPEPFWFFLFLGVRFWPLFLLGAIIAAVAALVSRGGKRLLAGLAAVLLALGPIGAAVVESGRRAEDARFQAEYDRTHTVLPAETTLDGITFPAGTEVTWEDASRTRFTAAEMPRPTAVLGVETDYVSRQGDDGWLVAPASPRVLDGWPCQPGHVWLGADGALRSCMLSEAVAWRGWTLPEQTGVTPRPAERKLGLFLPYNATVAYPGIERPLPQEVSVNDDGSLDAAKGPWTPLVICGVPLEGAVEWRYDLSTYGVGRDRPPVAVAGTTRVDVTTPVGTRQDLVRVVVRLPEGTVTREEAQ